MKINKIVGNNVKHFRMKAEITQVRMSEELIMSKSHLSAIENGHANPTLEMLARIADYLKAPLERLVWEERYRYSLVETVMEDDDTGRIIDSYSITLDEIWKGKIEHQVTARNISTDIAFVQGLVDRFNEEQLDPMHFLDAVEDALP